MPLLDMKRKRPYPVRHDIKAAIVGKGRVQAKIARQMGITPQHFNAVLNGYEPLTERLARDISRSTGIPLATILPSQDGDSA